MKKNYTHWRCRFASRWRILLVNKLSAPEKEQDDGYTPSETNFDIQNGKG